MAYVSQREILTEFAYGVLMRCVANGRIVDLYPSPICSPFATVMTALICARTDALPWHKPDAQARGGLHIPDSTAIVKTLFKHRLRVDAIIGEPCTATTQSPNYPA